MIQNNMTIESLNKTIETSDNEKKKIITIIVSDHNEKDLCEVLSERYAGDRWIDIIPYSEYNAKDESEMYIMVGDTVVKGENAQNQNEIIIDLSDSKIMDMIDSSMDLSTVRNQLVDGITLFKDTLIGIDYTDLKEVLQNRDNICVGFINSKSTTDMNGLVEKLIEKTKVNISECKSAYLYVNGDIGLMDVDRLAKALEALMGEDCNIAFTASYDSSKVEEYYIMVLITT